MSIRLGSPAPPAVRSIGPLGAVASRRSKPRLAPPIPLPPAALAAGILSAVLAATAGCGGADAGPPRITLDHSTCDGCGMLISDPGFAASWRDGDHTAAFDDIGCLLRSLDRDDHAAASAKVWVMDPDQRWLPASDVVFVISDRLETPMAGHVQAFSDRSAAERAAASTGGDLIADFARLRALARERDRARAATRGDHDAPSS
jgi:copper chaperone NosL